MEQIRQVRFLCAAMAVACSAHFVIASDVDTYPSIVEKNIFKLHAAAKPDPPLQRPIPKVNPNVAFTGVTDICGPRWALAELSEPGKPIVRAILSEGDKFGSVEIIAINVEQGRISV